MKRTTSPKDFKDYDWDRIWKRIHRSGPGFSALRATSRRHSGFLDINQIRYRRVGGNNKAPVYFADNDTFAGQLPALHDDADNTSDDIAFDTEIAELFRHGRTISEITADVISVCSRHNVAVDEPDFKIRLTGSCMSDPYSFSKPDKLVFTGRIILRRDTAADRKRRHDARLAFRKWYLKDNNTEAIAEALDHDPRLIDRFMEFEDAHLCCRYDRPVPTNRGKIRSHNEPLLDDITAQINTLNRQDGVPLNQIDDIDLADDLVLIGGTRRTEWDWG